MPEWYDFFCHKKRALYDTFFLDQLVNHIATMEYELTTITNTITNMLSSKIGLDQSATHVANMLILRLLIFIRNYDKSKLHIPTWAHTATDKVVSNLKYFIVLYVFKYLFEHRNQLTFRSPNKSINNQIEISPSDGLFEIDISNINKSINVVHQFISLHPEFFETNISCKFVHIGDNPEPYRVYNERLHFNDTIHHVSGYITTEFNSHIDHKGNYVYNYLMKLFIKRLIPCKHCYIGQLERYVFKQNKSGKVVSLRYYKVMPRNLITSSFYNETVEQWQSDVKYLNESYFCEHKDFLFATMESKMNGALANSNGWNNLILHGKPGSGKSSCIYRIATLMKRSIVSVDLSLYLDKKRELYNLFYGQQFQLPGEERKVDVDEDSIIVLEEFDNTIRKLLDLEKIHVLKQDLISTDFKQKQTMLLQPDNGDNTNNTNKHPSEKLSINKVSHEIDQAVHSNTIAIKNDTLRIFDLLELFQGVISPPNRIIIATTNHYEEIRQSLPSLFRPGRLSQIEFKYLSWNLLDELSQYYFHQPMSIDPIEITIPTSQITELALKHQLSGNHESFQMELQSLLS